ncbi:MAG: dTDP-4-dehydrorhamnose reductase [Alphaproteobacteria bacterium]|nr:dTDP-4-dehydrorhamnose reductase [Alphaproteobacteria bacterium]
MKLIVMGANGLMGQEFRRVLPTNETYFASRLDCDITDIVSVRKYIQSLGISDEFTIINCAANRDAERMENDNYDSAKKITVDGPHNLAVVANEMGGRLIHFSSDYVFDGSKNTPYTETDETRGLSIYGKLKVISEQDLMQTANTVVIIRPAWIFSQYGKDFVKTIYKLGQTNRELRVVYDQVGSPTYGADLARHVNQIIPKIKSGTREIYHLTNEGVCSWYDLACTIKQYCGLTCEIIPVRSHEYKQNAPRPSYSVLDKSKIKKDFNINIRHYSDALRECCDQIRGL